MTAEPGDLVRAFYRAVAARDAGSLADLLSYSFHEDAAISWPESLPYGGRIQGRRVLGKVFAGLASGAASVGPERLELLSVVDGGDQVAAQLGFDFRSGSESIPSGAIELWTFRDGLVVEIRAYYWDTTACAALVAETAAATA